MAKNPNQIPVACFAPPLTDEKLVEYQKIIDGVADAETKDAMQTCMNCVKAWWDLPESKRTDGRKFSIVHRGQSVEYSETPLEQEHVEALDAVTPWDRECTAMGDLFDKMPVDSMVRDAAYHLLWFAKEITRDREPMTLDLLG